MVREVPVGLKVQLVLQPEKNKHKFTNALRMSKERLVVLL